MVKWWCTTQNHRPPETPPPPGVVNAMSPGGRCIIRSALHPTSLRPVIQQASSQGCRIYKTCEAGGLRGGSSSACEDGAYIYITAPRGLKASSCAKKGALSREEQRPTAASSPDNCMSTEHAQACVRASMRTRGGQAKYFTNGWVPHVFLPQGASTVRTKNGGASLHVMATRAPESPCKLGPRR